MPERLVMGPRRSTPVRVCTWLRVMAPFFPVLIFAT